MHLVELLTLRGPLKTAPVFVNNMRSHNERGTNAIDIDRKSCHTANLKSRLINSFQSPFLYLLFTDHGNLRPLAYNTLTQ